MEKKAESTSSDDGPKEDLRPGGKEEKGAIHGAGNSGEHGPREWEPAHPGGNTCGTAPEKTDKDPCRRDGAGNSGEHRPREYHRCDEMGNSGEPGPREWEPAHPGGNTCGTAHTLVSPEGGRPDYNDRQWSNKTTSIQSETRTGDPKQDGLEAEGRPTASSSLIVSADQPRDDRQATSQVELGNSPAHPGGVSQDGVSLHGGEGQAGEENGSNPRVCRGGVEKSANRISCLISSLRKCCEVSTSAARGSQFATPRITCGESHDAVHVAKGAAKAACVQAADDTASMDAINRPQPAKHTRDSNIKLGEACPGGLRPVRPDLWICLSEPRIRKTQPIGAATWTSEGGKTEPAGRSPLPGKKKKGAKDNGCPRPPEIPCPTGQPTRADDRWRLTTQDWWPQDQAA